MILHFAIVFFSFYLLFRMKLKISSTLSVALTINYTYAFVVNSHTVNGKPSTHIIKLKSASIVNASTFEPTAFIRNHYTTFQNGNRKIIQGNFDSKPLAIDTTDDSALLSAVSTPSPALFLRNLDINQDFKTIVGSFDSAFATYLSQSEYVEYVEPNQVYKAAIFPPATAPKPYEADSNSMPLSNSNDTSQKQLLQRRNVVTQTKVPSWGIARVSHRDLKNLDSYSADEAAGAGIHVYVVDSGINIDHPDIKGRAFIEANYVDYEGDGDYAGHGTHVAGTIGGSLYGVAKNVILHSVKILDSKGDGLTTSLIEAVSHITEVAKPGRSLINISLTGPRSKMIDEVLSMAVREHGIPVFVSAGNTGDDACEYSPSANPDVFAVGASNDRDKIPSFSSYGDCVRVYAPGTNITSSWLEANVQTMDGTSMANPHVTGIAALLMSQHTFRSPHELYNAIVALATPGALEAASEDDNRSPKPLAYNGVA
ncbi:peptidase S8/S53 domain-containing protein [Mycotypha africana]|uniref:peptidase S8/S53 domain-containing protein n=1 Tax=Mycotypha africana TaxID=64632 RepID=UPI00230161ED|nr:peptidase S8/S53 domain-containing protein [Mycotypha africana]KAI8991471.1 peptidase S8/S53 domain-containing protein [Mycotypha africana]